MQDLVPDDQKGTVFMDDRRVLIASGGGNGEDNPKLEAWLRMQEVPDVLYYMPVHADSSHQYHAVWPDSDKG